MVSNSHTTLGLLLGMAKANDGNEHGSSSSGVPIMLHKISRASEQVWIGYKQDEQES